MHWSVSGKLPFVFLLLHSSWHLEAGRTVPVPDRFYVGPGKEF